MTDDDYEDITGSTRAENILFLTGTLLIFESDVPTAIYEEERTSKSCLPPVPTYGCKAQVGNSLPAKIIYVENLMFETRNCTMKMVA